MKHYLLILKNVWTSPVWYVWVGIVMLACWPVHSWPRFLLTTFLVSLVMPLLVMLKIWSEKDHE
jgi:hypothetical protein